MCPHISAPPGGEIWVWCLQVCDVKRQARLQVAALSPVDFLLCSSHPGWLCPTHCGQCFQGLQAPAPGWCSCRAQRRWAGCWDLNDSSSLLSSSWLYHQKCFLRRSLQPRKLHAQNSSVQPRNRPGLHLLLHVPASPLIGSRVSNRERESKDHLVYQ